MNQTCRLFFIGCLLSLTLCAQAQADQRTIPATLEKLRQHGFSSPASAARELAQDQGQLARLPAEIRMQYHAALASLYIAAENLDHAKVQIARLDHMGTSEQCAPCTTYMLVRGVQLALKQQELQKAHLIQARIDALAPSSDAALNQAIEYMRGSQFHSRGDHSRAIEHALIAADLAIKTGNPAEQVRSLNLLLLSNIGRRDLTRAEAAASEAYALAERIGFTYMMSYIRGNQGWLYSIKGESDKQLQSLKDALRIARAGAGMADAELVHLVNLAEYHAAQEDFPQAAQLARQATVLAEQQKKPTYKAVALMTLGQAQNRMGRPSEAIANMTIAVTMLAEMGAKGYLIDALERLADTYEQHGQHREALASLRRLTALRTELALAEREKAIAEAQEKFSTERKDHEIVRLSLENARRLAEVSARTWQQRVWAAAALALALGAILLLQLFRRARASNRRLAVSNASLSDQSAHDPLTGAFNRRHCQAVLEQQAALIATRSPARQNAPAVGLILLDVDHFKHINDTYGHAAGDAVLVEIARRLQELVRQLDVVVRWGGEEFVLVLPGTGSEGLLVLAERMLQKVGATPILAEGKAISVTVSAGCVNYPMLPDQHWEDSLKVADAAMYFAKHAGRNRAVCVTAVSAEALGEQLIADLAASQARGHVSLSVIHGPESAPVQANEPPAIAPI